MVEICVARVRSAYNSTQLIRGAVLLAESDARSRAQQERATLRRLRTGHMGGATPEHRKTAPRHYAVGKAAGRVIPYLEHGERMCAYPLFGDQLPITLDEMIFCGEMRCLVLLWNGWHRTSYCEAHLRLCTPGLFVDGLVSGVRVLA